jgi:hypothetical protein
MDTKVGDVGREARIVTRTTTYDERGALMSTTIQEARALDLGNAGKRRVWLRRDARWSPRGTANEARVMDVVVLGVVDG